MFQRTFPNFPVTPAAPASQPADAAAPSTVGHFPDGAVPGVGTPRQAPPRHVPTSAYRGPPKRVMGSQYVKVAGVDVLVGPNGCSYTANSWDDHAAKWKMLATWANKNVAKPGAFWAITSPPGLLVGTPFPVSVSLPDEWCQAINIAQLEGKAIAQIYSSGLYGTPTLGAYAEGTKRTVYVRAKEPKDAIQKMNDLKLAHGLSGMNPRPLALSDGSWAAILPEAWSHVYSGALSERPFGKVPEKLPATVRNVGAMLGEVFCQPGFHAEATTDFDTNSGVPFIECVADEGGNQGPPVGPGDGSGVTPTPHTPGAIPNPEGDGFCPAGFTPDPIDPMNFCVPNAAPGCPAGQIFDVFAQKCVTNDDVLTHGCPPGQSEDPATGACVCPAGQFPDGDGVCQPCPNISQNGGCLLACPTNEIFHPDFADGQGGCECPEGFSRGPNDDGVCQKVTAANPPPDVVVTVKPPPPPVKEDCPPGQEPILVEDRAITQKASFQNDVKTGCRPKASGGTPWGWIAAGVLVAGGVAVAATSGKKKGSASR